MFVKNCLNIWETGDTLHVEARVTTLLDSWRHHNTFSSRPSPAHLLTDNKELDRLEFPGFLPTKLQLKLSHISRMIKFYLPPWLLSVPVMTP